MDLPAVRRIRQIVDSSNNLLAGPETLRDLSIAAYKLTNDADDKCRAVAYALHQFLAACWYDHDERVLEVGEADHFVSIAKPSLLNALDFLAASGSAETAIHLIAQISKAEDVLLPHQKK
jgi:hypothetical protein